VELNAVFYPLGMDVSRIALKVVTVGHGDDVAFYIIAEVYKELVQSV
jgi:hypothetical protein